MDSPRKSRSRPAIRVLNIAAPVLVALFPALCRVFPFSSARTFDYGGGIVVTYYDMDFRGEWGPIEVPTHLLLLAAAIGAALLSLRAKRLGDPATTRGFYAVFAAGLLFTFLEEISWGQHLFNYATPEIFRELNRQQEMNFHNLSWWHRSMEVPQVLFGLGGLLGIFAAPRIAPLETAAPPRFLLPWFLVIAVFAACDLVEDFNPDFYLFYPFFFGAAAEYTELLIAASAALYVASKLREPPRVPPPREDAA